MRLSIEKKFGEELCRIRKERGLSQEQLGFESEYHRTYISQLERGVKSPSLRSIFRLCKALALPASELMKRVEDNKS